MKRGRNGAGYEQEVELSDGAVVLSPKDQEPIVEAVGNAGAVDVARALRDALTKAQEAQAGERWSEVDDLDGRYDS